MRAMKNIVILISGRGSNMEAVVRAAQAEQWPARIAAVISNRADAQGLVFAAEHGIATAVVANKDYASREQFDAALQAVIDGFAPDLVVLAGFMRILTLFPGMATHRQALEAGVTEHGATVHFVTAELDHGPAVASATVPVLPGDTEDSLSARVLVQEHLLYPRAIRLFIDDKLSVEHGQVRVDPQ